MTDVNADNKRVRQNAEAIDHKSLVNNNN